MKRLLLVLLGPFQVRLDGAPVELLRRHKASALLAYLTVSPDEAHPRGALAGLLWPGYPEASARSSLSQALFSLRAALSDSGAPDVVDALLTLSRADVRLNSSALSSDLGEFVEHLARAGRHRHAGGNLCADCAGDLRSALQLYRGDLLEGFTLGDSPEFEEWLVVARERFRRIATQAAGVLAVWMETAGEPEHAVADARKWVDLDPLDEAAHRSLMRALIRSERRSLALAHYEVCRRTLQAELGVEPEIATRELFERIRSGDPALSRSAQEPSGHEAPVRAAQPLRHNLPAAVDTFVGRERETAEVRVLLRDPAIRLVTLVGAGGMGKTRLALEVARASLASYPEGAWIADLGPLPPVRPSEASEDTGAVRAVALALGVREDAGEEGLLAALRARRLLLLLDNCEHVLGAVAPLIARLLGACSELTILATSREPLRVAGEHLYEVPPLSLPPIQDLTVGMPPDDWAGQMLSYGAVRLLAERASAARYGATIDSGSMAAAVAVCRHLDGMPLAIELAATRLSALTLDELARRLEGPSEGAGPDGLRWTLLSAGSRSAQLRQQTLLNTVAWSYGLLDAREQHLFDRLGVFTGSFGLEGALAVSTGVCSDGDAPLLLAGLVDRSLVQRLPAEGGAQRFRLLETLRTYALERLDERGECGIAAALHAGYMLALAERIEPVLRLGEPHFVQALRALDAERDNLSAAILWSLAGDGVSALRIVGAVQWWATHRNRLAEYQAWALSALALTPEEPGEEAMYRARALNLVAHYRYNWMQFDELREIIHAEQAAALRAENPSAIAWSYFYEAKRSWLLDHDAHAVALMRDCLAGARACGEVGMAAHVAVELASLEPRELRLAALEDVLAHTPEGFRAFTFQVASGVAAEAGYLERAEAWMRESIRLWSEMDNPRMVGSTTRDLAPCVALQGRLEEAEALYSEGARLCRRGGDENGCIIALAGRCELLWMAGKPSALEAVRSLLREPYGFGPRRYGVTNRQRIARVVIGLGERELGLRLLAEAEAGRAPGDGSWEYLALEARGWDALLGGDAAAAVASFRDALAEARESDSRPGSAEAAEHLAWALAEAGQLDESAALLAEAASEREAMGMVLFSVEVPHHERAMTLVARREQ